MNTDYNKHYSKNLNKVLYYLDKPNLDPKGKPKYFNLIQRISQCVAKIFNRIARLWNYLCGDGYAYNELKACKIVCLYLDRKQFSEPNNKTIIEIYDRLKQLQLGSKSYADTLHSKYALEIEALRNPLKKIVEEEKPPEEEPVLITAPLKPKLKPKIINKPKPKEKIDADSFLVSSYKPPEATQIIPTVTATTPTQTAVTIPTQVQTEDPISILPEVPIRDTIEKIDESQFTSTFKPDSNQNQENQALSHKLNHYKNLPKPSLRLLMHLHGNRFGENSKLEGLTRGQPKEFKYLQKYLHKQLESSDHPTIRKFVTRLDGAIDLMKCKDVESFSKLLKNKLQDMSKPTFIPGGWVGNPWGHFLIYEFIAESSDHVTMRIYDSAEAPYLKSAIVGNKNKFQPYVEWKGIKKSSLNDHLIQAIAEMNYCRQIPKTSFNTDYDAKDVYIALKAILNPTHTDELTDPRLLTSPQSAALCGMRGLFAALCTYLHNDCGPLGIAIYKRFKCDIRIQTLIDCLPTLEDSVEINSYGKFRLIKKSLMKTSRAINKLYAKSMVSDLYLIDASTALQEVEKWLKNNTQLSAKKSVKPTFKPISGKLKLNTLKSTTESLAKNSIESFGEITESLKKLAHNNFEMIEKTLHEVSEIANEGWLKGLDQATYAGLIYFINRLPIDANSYCPTHDPSTIKILIANLGKVAQTLFKNYFTIQLAEVIVPERREAFIKLMLIQSRLAKLLNQSFTYHISKHVPSYYIHTDQQSKTLFSAKEADYINGLYGIDGIRFFQGRENQIVEMAKSLPEIHENVIGHIHNFKNRSTASQNAEIYAHPNLPDWLKAMRDTEIYLLYLEQSHMAKPLELDRKNAFQISFNISHSKESSEIKFEISGIKISRFSFDSIPYKTMHGFLSSESDAIKVLDSVSKHNVHAEKELLTNHQAFLQLKIDREDYQDLYHIFSDPHTQFIEAFEYFYKNSEKLKIKEYQVLFRVACFSNPKLSCDVLKGIEVRLSKFLDQQFKLWATSNEIQAAVYLIQTKRFLRSFFPTLAEDSFINLRKLLALRNLDNSAKSVIYAELIAQIAKKESDQLSPLDLTDLLTGLSFLKQYPVPEKWREQLTENEIEKALHLHANAVLQFLYEGNQPHQKNLNLICEQLSSNAKNGKWKIQNKDELISEDGRYLYRPLVSEFIDIKESEAYLPEEIKGHPYFKLLFKGINKGKRLSNQSYSFDQNKRVTLCNDTLHIEQIIDGKWATYIPYNKILDKNLNSIFGSRYLSQNFSHWIVGNKIFFQNLVTKKFEYTAFINGSYVTKILSKDNLSLSQTSPLLTDFEDPSYIHEWYNENYKLTKIELPRFSLSFTVSDNICFCDQFPGYFLAEDQTAKQIDPYQHYIVLENSDKQKKVLIPNWKFKTNKNIEVLEANFKVDFCLSEDVSNKQLYFAYDIDSKETLSTRSLEANLYLVKILTALQKYTEASAYLKKYGFKVSPYSETEVAILEEICCMQVFTGDHDGNAIGIQIYAGFLLLKNAISNGNPSEKYLSSIFNVYREYLNQYGNSVQIRLKRLDEIFLLTNLLQFQFDPLLFLRLRDLDLPAAKTITKPKESAFNALTKHVTIRDLIPSLLDYRHRHIELDIGKPSYEKALITRPFPSIKHLFWGYYVMSINGNETDKDWFKNATNFLICSNQPEEKMMGEIFKCIQDNVAKFTIPPASGEINVDSSQYKQLEKWRDNLIETLQKLHDEFKKSEKASEKAPELKNFTPPDFQIDPLKKEIKPTEITIKLEVETNKKSLSAISKELFQKKDDEKNGHCSAFKSWLKDRLKNSQDLEKRVYEKLESEMEESTSVPHYLLKKNVTLAQIKTSLNEQDREFTKNKHKYEEDILALCHKTSPIPFDNAQRLIALSGGTEKPFTFEEIIICFARYKKFPDALRHKNPALDAVDISRIFQLTYEYLLEATHEQQRLRALETLSKIEKLNPHDKAAHEDLLQQLALDFKAKHAFDPIEEPYFLVFEYFVQILLRKEQVLKIKEFTEKGDLNPIVEMLMGFGKSKILMPLIALLFGKPNSMSLLVCPQSLFENIASNTHKILHGAFGQSLYSLHFDRNSSFSEHALLNIAYDLEELKKEGGCLLMTGKSLQCLILKFLETFNSEYEIWAKDKPNTLPYEITLMQRILNCFNGANALIDEADSVLNILKKVCFSMGQRYFPVDYEVQIIKSIYSLLYSNSDLKQVARLESDPTPDKNAPILTDQIYQNELKYALAETFLDNLASLKLGSAIHQSALKAFLENLKDNRELAIKYLTRDLNHLEESQQFYKQQSNEIKEVLALAGQVISQFLSHTLTRVSNEKYGIDLDSNLNVAIPFLAANTPSKGSLFSNYHVTMMYTFQIIAKNGISHKLILHEIERMQSQAVLEMRNSTIAISIEETHAWKRFELLKGNVQIALMHNYRENPHYLDEIVKQINKNMQTKLTFAEQVLIPQLDLYEKHISCNPINLSSLLTSLSGFTGTLWNARSLHRKIKDIPAENINAKTLNILFSKCRESIISLEENEIEAMMKQLHNQIKNFDVIIDAGGYFKNGSNLEIARIMAKWLQTNTKKKHVVFYNVYGEQTITDGEREVPLAQSSIPESERVVFLDQDHTVGADVSYTRDAIGVLTCGPLMLDRDFKQGAWRLRRIDKLQTVVFALSDDVKKIIQQTIGSEKKVNLDSIAQFVIANQCKQQNKDNFKSFLHQLWDIPQQILLTYLLKLDLEPAEYFQLFKLIENQWVKSAYNNASILYGNIAYERPTPGIIQEEKERCVAFLKKLAEECPWLSKKGFLLEKSLSDVDQLIEYAEEFLPKTAVHPELDAELSVEVELQQEEQLERDTEIEMHDDTLINQNVSLSMATGSTYEYLSHWSKEILKRWYSVCRFPLSDYFTLHKDLNDYVRPFDDLHITNHAFAIPENAKSLKEVQLFGIYRTPLHFVDISGNEVTILSQLNAAYFIKNPRQGLYNLELGYCFKSEKPSQSVLKKIVKVKFLNGNTHYNREESLLLEAWLREFGPKRMKELFVKRILPGFPNKVASYHGSALHRIFHKLLNKSRKK